MKTLFDEHKGRSVRTELEHAVRTRGVREQQRLELLRTLAEADGEAIIEARIAALEARLRETSRKVVSALRGSSR